MNENNGTPKYDMKRRSRAGTAATLRAIVAIYVAYMVYNVLRGTIDGSSTLPVWAGWVLGIALLAADAVFAYYIWRTYQADLASAILPEEEESEADGEEDAPEE